MYSVSRTSGDDSRRMGQVHRKHDIPWNASLVAIVFAFIAPVVVAIWQDHNSSSAAGWLGGVFVFFALVAYMMVNLANIVYHLRHARAEFNWFMNGLVPVLGIVIDGYILYRAFFVAYMQESFQLGKSIVFLSIAWTLIGAIWAVLRGTRQQAGLAARARVHATAEGD
jgi:amino acid transporter